MLHGYPVVQNLCGGLQRFMTKHGFTSVADFKGASLPYFTTHSDLVARQRAALAAKKAKVRGGDGNEREREREVEERGRDGGSLRVCACVCVRGLYRGMTKCGHWGALWE